MLLNRKVLTKVHQHLAVFRMMLISNLR